MRFVQQGPFLGVSFLRKPMGYVGDDGALCADGDVAAREMSAEKRSDDLHVW